MDETTRARAVIAFNSFWSTFLQDLKGVDDDVRKAVEDSGCKVIVKTSDEYLLAFKRRSPGEILDGLSVDDVAASLERQGRVADQAIVDSHVDALRLCAHLYDVADETLFKAAMDVIAKVQRGKSREDVAEDLDSIIDGTAHELLERIVAAAAPPPPPATHNHPCLPEEGGLICSLAKEISEEIDVSSLPAIEKPEDVLKCLSGDGTNVMGDLLHKVSSKIQQRLSSGQISQEQLMAEAMSMMASLNPSSASSSASAKGGDVLGALLSPDNPLMAQALRAMGGGGGNTNVNAARNRLRHQARGTITKERLRAKLAARRGEHEEDPQ